MLHAVRVSPWRPPRPRAVDLGQGAQARLAGGRHQEVSARKGQFRHHAEDLDAGRVQSGFLFRFPQRCIRDGFARVDAAAREGNLPRMVIQRLGTLQKQDIQIGRGKQFDRGRRDIIERPEEHQHSCPADTVPGFDDEFAPARIR